VIWHFYPLIKIWSSISSLTWNTIEGIIFFQKWTDPVRRKLQHRVKKKEAKMGAKILHTFADPILVKCVASNQLFTAYVLLYWETYHAGFLTTFSFKFQHILEHFGWGQWKVHLTLVSAFNLLVCIWLYAVL